MSRRSGNSRGGMQSAGVHPSIYRPDMSQGSAGCTSRKQVQFGTKRNQTKTPNVWDFEVIHNTEGLVS